MDSLAGTLRNLKRYEEALELQEKVLEIRKETLGENQLNTIRAMSSLAFTLNLLERHEEALKLQEKVFELYKETLGENHPDTISAMNILEGRLNLLGRYEKALELQEKIFELTKKTFSEDNQIFIERLANLAEAQYFAGFNTDALKNIKRAQELQNKYLPEDTQLKEKMGLLYSLITAEKIDAPKKITVVKTQKLIKGQRADLTKNNPDLKNLLAEFILSAPLNFEIDATAFLLDKNGKVLNDEDFIFYGNLKHSSGGVEYLQAADSNKLQINIELEKIPADIEKITLALSIYDAEERAQNFSSVNATIKIFDNVTCAELLNFNLGENFLLETTVIAGEIYRNKGEWKFNAVGAGFKNGLNFLCKKFGIKSD